MQTGATGILVPKFVYHLALPSVGERGIAQLFINGELCMRGGRRLGSWGTGGAKQCDFFSHGAI